MGGVKTRMAATHRNPFNEGSLAARSLSGAIVMKMVLRPCEQASSPAIAGNAPQIHLKHCPARRCSGASVESRPAAGTMRPRIFGDTDYGGYQKECTMCQVDVQLDLNTPDQRNGLDGIPAEREEVVVDRHPLASQYVGEQLGDPLFPFGRRGGPAPPRPGRA